ncbi:MAG TPA: VWA domain-containing protein [Leucothrix sp.]|nr:VWA domain-containing protein [Leucothrix sp.]
MSRQLPVYLLIDSSGSMNGEPINSVNEGLRAMMNALRQDPYALETVLLSVITFDREVKEIFTLTPIEEVQLDDIVPPPSGATHMGEALKYLLNRYRKDIKTKKEGVEGSFSPMVFIMTDGKPSDLQLFEEMVTKINTLKFASIVGCAAGPKAKTEFLRQFADPVVSMESTDSSSFSAFFKWVSASIASGNQSGGIDAAGANQLPPPPTEVNIVV